VSLKQEKYYTYGDPKPDGTYQIEKKLWDGTSIQVSQRVGTDEREWARDKLGHFYALGFLALPVYQAREKAAVAAVTREDLNKLISDLPAHEDDWKSVRKVPVDRALLQEAIEATAPQERRSEPFFLYILLGLAALIMGLAGVMAQATTSLTVYAGALAVMGFLAFLRGVFLAQT